MELFGLIWNLRGWQQDLDKMAAQFKKLQKEIEEGQKR